MVKQKAFWGCWSKTLNSSHPPELLLNGNSADTSFSGGEKNKTFRLKITQQQQRRFWFLSKEYYFSFYTKSFLVRLLRKDKSSVEIRETKPDSLDFRPVHWIWKHLTENNNEGEKKKKTGQVDVSLWNGLVKHHHWHWSVPSPSEISDDQN